MPAALRKLLVVFLLGLGLAVFALIRDDASEEGLVLWNPLAVDADIAEDESAPDEPPPIPESTVLRAEDLADTPMLVTGRVLTSEGLPLGGVEVRRRHPYLQDLATVTDEHGAFELALDAARGDLELGESAWIVLGGRWHVSPDAKDDYLIVAAPRSAVRGQVLGPDGAPRADVLVRIAAPGDALVPFGVPTPPVELESWRAWTNSDGRFRIDDAPRMSGVSVRAEPLGLGAVTASADFVDGVAEVVLRLNANDEPPPGDGR